MSNRFKTNVRMLPQSGPLEVLAVDNSRGSDETGQNVMPVANIGEGSSPQGECHTARKGNSVLVLDKHKKPLMPCSAKRAGLLLERGKAVVHRPFPFTIRLRDRVGGDVQPVRIKVDPGSRTTGAAVVREEVAVAREEEGKTIVLWLAELQHRGQRIRDRLTARRAFRRQIDKSAVQGIHAKHRRLIARAGGYSYSLAEVPLPSPQPEVSPDACR